MRNISLVVMAGVLAACTQQQAEVVLRGHEDFSQKQGMSHPSTQIASAAPVSYPSSAPVAETVTAAPAMHVDESTSNMASLSAVTSSDLPPPSAAPVKPEPVKTAAKPVSKAPPQLAKAETPQVRNPYIWPVEGGKVTAKFGPAGKGKANDGITIAAESGEPVYATANGEVVFVGDQVKGYGHMVLIKHKGGITTTYAHLGRASVSRYDRVKQGDIIGYVGTSGPVKRPQLYFSMHEGTKAVDPQRYLSKSYAEAN